MIFIIFVLIVIAIVVLGSLFLYLGFGIRWQIIPDERRIVFYNLIVPDEEKVVLHRLGQFRRIAGPGPVVLRWGEEVKHTIDVSHRARTVPVDNLYIKGVPFQYMIDIWYRVSPTECTDDPEELAHLAHLTSQERRRIIRSLVHDALSQSLYEAEQELEEGKPFLAKLVPILPGFPPNITLLERTFDRLAAMLPTAGVVLRPDRPIIISNLTLDTALGSEMSRDRMVQLLREQFPDLDDEMYLQAYAVIAGKSLPRTVIQSGNDTTVDFGLETNGEAKPRRVRSHGNRGQRTTKSDAATVDQPDQKSAAAEIIKDDDWHVMKELPAA